MQEQWELARWSAWQNMLLSPNIKPGNKPKSAQAFCRFPWEQTSEEELTKKAEQYKVTEAEVSELNRIFAEWEAGKQQTS